MLANEEILPNGMELVDGVHYNIPVVIRKPSGGLIEPHRIKCEKVEIPKTYLRNLDSMTEEKYRSLEKGKFGNNSNIATRKMVLRFIEMQPELWSRKKVRVEEQKWQLLAIDLYKRTGILCEVAHIRTIFGLAKKFLREQLIESIRSNDDPYETEGKLAKWELYNHIRFYRETLKELEDALRSQESDDTFAAIIEADAPNHLDEVLCFREVTMENGIIERIMEMQTPLVLGDNDTGTAPRFEMPARLPGLRMTVEEYHGLGEEKFNKNGVDKETRKLIIGMMEDYPNLWNHMKMSAGREEWDEFAVELFLRSGLILRVEFIISFFNQVKEMLRMKLELSIMRGNNSQQTELELDAWEYYHHIKFFRVRTAIYEQEVRQKYEKLDYDKNLVERKQQFSDLIPIRLEDLEKRIIEAHSTHASEVEAILKAMTEIMTARQGSFLESMMAYQARHEEILTQQQEEKENEPM